MEIYTRKSRRILWWTKKTKTHYLSRLHVKLNLIISRQNYLLIPKGKFEILSGGEANAEGRRFRISEEYRENWESCESAEMLRK